MQLCNSPCRCLQHHLDVTFLAGRYWHTQDAVATKGALPFTSAET